MMPRATITLAAMLSLVSALSASPAGAQEPADEPKAETNRPEPKAADGDAPLPEGFPDATKPGIIEVKSYPAYRSAIAKGEGMTSNSGDFLFFYLFNHIQKKGVEMTAPVINTYESTDMVAKPDAKGKVTMEFLYQSTKQGETGDGVGPVKVEDHPAGQFVCLGIQGDMERASMTDGMARLTAWLDAHKAEWVAAGPPRRLGYHGPMTPPAQRLWELQVPIKAVKDVADDKGTDEPGKN